MSKPNIRTALQPGTSSIGGRLPRKYPAFSERDAAINRVSLKVIEQFWHDLVERPDGPMRFRFVLQPVMATIVAIRDGLKDARSGRSPYLATVLGNPQKRIGRLREGLDGTARIIALGLVMDVIYQALVFKTFYPDQALVVALVLAFVPYVIVREVIARVWRSQRPAQ